MSLGIVFLSEVAGTALLTLLGCGVVANVALKGTKGNSGGFLLVNWGWGLAVMSGVFVAAKSGAHLNPAVTVGLLANGKAEYAPGVAVSFASTMTYFGAEMLGAFIGAVLSGSPTSSTLTVSLMGPPSWACSQPVLPSAAMDGTLPRKSSAPSFWYS